MCNSMQIYIARSQTSYNASLAADIIWKQKVIQISIYITCMPHALMIPKSGHNS